MVDSSASITKRQTFLLAFVVGAAVANIYYIQPLLPALANEFQTSATGVGFIAMLMQFGTAVGMLVFVPLGDTHDRRALAFWLLIAAAASLALFAVAEDKTMLAIASLLIGLTASSVHILVPFASQLAPAHRKGAAVGMVLSGLLLGILLARTLSGYLSQWAGWRTVYFLATVMMIVAAFGIRIELPSQKLDTRLSYIKLLRSALTLVREQPVVREATITSALLFFAFSAFWATLAFFLGTGSYSYGAAAAGNFGLVGALGALTAPVIGKFADRYNVRKNVLLTVALAVASFVIMGIWGEHLAGLVLGVLLLDIGMQGTHVSNQTRIYAVLPEAKSRLNMIYMFIYFLAGSLGSLIGSKVWGVYRWPGVCALGVVATMSATVPLVAALAQRTRSQTAIV